MTIHPMYVYIVESLYAAAHTSTAPNGLFIAAACCQKITVNVRGRTWEVLWDRNPGDRVRLGKGESFIGDGDDVLMSACQHAGQLCFRL